MANLIFTTVGTSVFQNFLYNHPESKEFFDENIKGFDIKNPVEEKIIKFKEKVLKECLQNYPANISKTSAEIQSLYQMKKEHFILPEKDKLTLLYSDTLEGKIAGDILYQFFKNKNNLSFENISKPICMENIRGDKAENFSLGLTNLLEKLEIQISKNFNSIFLNFTGGYKGIIPILTIFSNIITEELGKNCSLFYMYEKTDTIIKFSINGNNIDLTINSNKSSITNADRIKKWKH